MAKKWYVDSTHTKVTVTAGTAAADILLVTQVGSGRPTLQLWRPAGATVSAAEASAANGEQDAGAIPAEHMPPPAAPPLVPGGTDATQAQLAAETARAQAAETHGPGSEIASSVLVANFTITGTIAITVPGWQITVPANSGPIELEVVGGVCITVNTGTVGVTTKINTFARIVDDLGNVVAYGPCDLNGAGANLAIQATPACGTLLPNNVADRTYHVEVQCSQVGVSGCTAAVPAAAPFPNRTLRAIRR